LQAPGGERPLQTLEFGEHVLKSWSVLFLHAHFGPLPSLTLRTLRSKLAFDPFLCTCLAEPPIFACAPCNLLAGLSFELLYRENEQFLCVLKTSEALTTNASPQMHHPEQCPPLPLLAFLYVHKPHLRTPPQTTDIFARPHKSLLVLPPALGTTPQS
jgi:hypothetical protein